MPAVRLRLWRHSSASHPIADEIHEHTKHLLPVRDDLEISRDRVDELDITRRFERDHFHDLGHQRPQRKPRRFGRIVDGTAIGQRRLTKTDRAIERGNELGREPLDQRIVNIRETVGDAAAPRPAYCACRD